MVYVSYDINANRNSNVKLCGWDPNWKLSAFIKYQIYRSRAGPVKHTLYFSFYNSKISSH